jgi:hypothetical protein
VGERRGRDAVVGGVVEVGGGTAGELLAGDVAAGIDMVGLVEGVGLLGLVELRGGSGVGTGAELIEGTLGDAAEPVVVDGVE